MALRAATLTVAVCLVTVAPATAADKLKAGWTTEAVQSASDECTEALVQGTWENSQREPGGDPSKPVTKEFRKKNAAEIAKMKKLCACAVREGAKRYTREEAEATPADLERAVSESIANGTCKVDHQSRIKRVPSGSRRVQLQGAREPKEEVKASWRA